MWRKSVATAFKFYLQGRDQVGYPWARVDGPLYSSPEGYQPDQDAQAIYRERVSRAREKAGLPPIDY